MAFCVIHIYLMKKFLSKEKFTIPPNKSHQICLINQKKRKSNVDVFVSNSSERTIATNQTFEHPPCNYLNEFAQINGSRVVSNVNGRLLMSKCDSMVNSRNHLSRNSTMISDAIATCLSLTGAAMTLRSNSALIWKR
jgi:hypothetical protein